MKIRTLRGMFINGEDIEALLRGGPETGNDGRETGPPGHGRNGTMGKIVK